MYAVRGFHRGNVLYYYAGHFITGEMKFVLSSRKAVRFKDLKMAKRVYNEAMRISQNLLSRFSVVDADRMTQLPPVKEDERNAERLKGHKEKKEETR